MNAERSAVWSPRASPTKGRSRWKALPQCCDSYLETVSPSAVNEPGGPQAVQAHAPHPPVRLGPPQTRPRFGGVQRIQSP